MATAQELCEGLDPASIGHSFSLQSKLTKHLTAKDDLRVRDYLIVIRCLYPDFRSCPIDMDLLKKSADFLRVKGWNLYLQEDHNDRVSQYIRRH